ncbi:hypothetical protein BC629DRAFT_1724296 [Irpex lacteus]|nr:hypothetical protein BC629DRAFT_1724296 [Irpex lacteus]
MANTTMLTLMYDEHDFQWFTILARVATIITFILCVLLILLFPFSAGDAIPGLIYDPATIQSALRGYAEGTMNYQYCALALLIAVVVHIHIDAQMLGRVIGVSPDAVSRVFGAPKGLLVLSTFAFVAYRAVHLAGDRLELSLESSDDKNLQFLSAAMVAFLRLIAVYTAVMVKAFLQLTRVQYDEYWTLM